MKKIQAAMSIAILTGPVWFLDSALFESTCGTAFMGSVQLDRDIDFRRRAS